MSRLFCHISEFELDGYELIPAMMFAGDRLMVWAPSALQLKAAKEAAGKRAEALVEPDDVLELVRRNKLQVMGRRRWLLEPEERLKSKWEYATWVPEYDDEIARLAVDEEKQEGRPEHRKVRLFGPEEGNTWARDEVAADTERARTAAKLLAGKQLPSGVIEKAQREQRKASDAGTDPERAGVEAVLRDIYNHEEMLRLCGANAPVTFGFRALLELQELEIPGAPHRPAPPDWADGVGVEDLDGDRLLELLELAASLSRPRDVDELVQLVSRKDIEQLRKEMWQLTLVRGPLELELQRRIEQAAPRLRKRDLSPTAEEGSIPRQILSIALSLITEGGKLNLLPTVGPELLDPVKRGLQKTSLMAAPGYTGPLWPFVLAYNRTDPAYMHIDEVTRYLKDYFNSRAG